MPFHKSSSILCYAELLTIYLNCYDGKLGTNINAFNVLRGNGHVLNHSYDSTVAGYFRKGVPIIGLSVKRGRQLPRVFGRTSTIVAAVEVTKLRELASKLLRTIHYTGLAELEFMWDAKHARFELLEVNARLWVWHGLAIAADLELL